MRFNSLASLPRTLAIQLLWSIPVFWLLVSPYTFWHFAWIWVGFRFGVIALFSAKLIKKSSDFLLAKPQQEKADKEEALLKAKQGRTDIK